MAKRTYKRDARGRSKGGGGKPAAKAKPASKPATPKAPPKTTTARGRARQVETRARQAVKAGGGSKATRSLLVAQRARDYYKATGSGTKRSRTKAPPQRPTSGIRRTGGLPTVKPASNIRPTTGPRRAPLGGARNAIRTFNPTTNRAKADQMRRQIDRIGREIKSSRDKIKGGANKLMEAKRRFDRGTARDLVDSKKPGLTGELARLTLSFASPRMVRGAQNVIRSRAARARAAADRGSAAGKRALEIYGNQLAFTGAGKTPRGAKNKIVPGPRSTQPPAKPKRRAKAKTLGDVVGISTPAAKAPAKPRATAKPKPAAKPKAKPAAKPKATAKPKAPEKGGAIIKRPSSAIVRQQPSAPAPAPAPRPSAQNRPGSITSTLRGMLGSLAKLDAARAREIENITGKPIPVPKRTAKPRIPGGSTGSGSVTGTMRGAMRGLAQSDARFIREVQSMIGPSTPKSLGSKGGKSKGSLPASKPPSKPRKRKPKPKP